MEKLLKVTYLYDFYGQLLTDKQKKIFRRYYLEDLSLSEIADEEEVSRQSIHDTIKQAERKLTAYEDKLGLVEKFKDQEQAFKVMIDKMEMVKSNNQDQKVDEVISDIIESMHKLFND